MAPKSQSGISAPGANRPAPPPPSGVIDLAAPWPLGLSGRNWLVYAIGLLVVLIAFLPSDHPVSVAAQAQGPETLALFNQITRWGESDWILIPSFVLLILAGIAFALVKRRLIRLALLELIQIVGFIFVGVGLPSLVANLIKHPIGRARPPLYDQYGLFRFSPVCLHLRVPGLSFGPHGDGIFGGDGARFSGAALVSGRADLRRGDSRLTRHCRGALSDRRDRGLVIGVIGAYALRVFFARRRWGFEYRAGGDIVQREIVALPRLFEQSLAHRATP